MNQHLLAGNPPLRIYLRRSAQAKRMSLRVSRLDGKVTLTVPKFVTDREALGFAKEKEDWLRTHCEKQPEVLFITHEMTLPIEGQSYRVTDGAGRRIRTVETNLIVPGKPETVGRRVQAYLRELARDRLASASDHYAVQLGRGYSRLTLRDTRSRWGSCTSDGALMYSWRLILAPPKILNYVAAHEVAHLEEMNHSKAFWDIVHDLYGPYQTARKWLHENGADLYRYRFDD
jgi:predicted metal-dependent hydrolase